MFSWWSCEKFTERVSKALDGTLPWYEKPAYYFRLMMCSTSRRFRRQMYTLERIASECPRVLEEDPSSSNGANPATKLSPSACERIKKALSQSVPHT